MYGRKLKVKKKTKTGIKSNDGGSNWGPRVALYERERELATHQQYIQKQQLLQQQQQQPHHQALTSSSASVSNNSATYSSHYGLQDSKYSSKQQLQRLKEKENNDSGIVASSINSHYSGSNSSSYHNRAAPTLPTSAPTSRPGKVLPSGSSSRNKSSTGNLSKPLTVIIPPPEHFTIASSEFGHDKHSSVPSTKTWRSSPDHQHDIGIESDTDRGHRSNGISPPPEFALPKNNSRGILVSPTTAENIVAKRVAAANDIFEEKRLKRQQIQLDSNRRNEDSNRKGDDANRRSDDSNRKSDDANRRSDDFNRGSNDSNRYDSNRVVDHLVREGTPEKPSGAAISALAQGLAMVYVPMESLPAVAGPSSKISNKSAEQQAVENLDDVIESISKSGRSSSASSIAYSDATDDVKVNKPLLAVSQETKDPENDSLLESFDSVMFKPKGKAIPGNNNGLITFNGSTTATISPTTSGTDASNRGYENTRVDPTDLSTSAEATGLTRAKQQISESPPPLPPPNAKPKKLDKTLRFSEQLENFHQSPFHRPKINRLGKKVSIPMTPETLSSQHSQQDTQSVTTEVQVHRFDNDQPTSNVNSESSIPKVLSCGHMKTSSNYSTLSSITSSLTDEDQEDRNKAKREPRSAIQQLRDLSILIGGGQDNVNELPPVTTTTNNKDKLKSEKLRRDSQGSSGTDSGKGSGSGQSPTENSPKGKNTFGVPCAFSKGDCDDCFKVFKNPLAIDSSCSHSSGTSPLSSQDRCENYHRHLIIQEQSRNSKHSGGKSSRSHQLISSHQGNTTSSSSSGSGSTGGGSKKTKKSKKHKKTHQLVFEYCDCRHCDCSAHQNQRQPGVQSALLPKTVSKKKLTSQNLLMGKHSTGLTGSNNDILNMIPNNASNRNKRSPGNSSSSGNDSHQTNSHLFTIDEEEIGEVGPDFTANSNTNQNQTFMDATIKDLNSDDGNADHWHPKCWLATDPTMGWSDLESLYSQNVKLERPLNINDECWTCWKEIAETRKFSGPDANRTVDRTKRMFIWLNKRHKEFNAPWWEAKKQASIRWLITKAFAHLSKEAIGDPFKESKKGKPKYRLKDEVIKGLVNGKLYCLALDHLYQNQHYRSGGLTHWDIIKILSRRGVYVAQPSDMKLTEGTLRQKKPLRIAAHIALIEAIMGLYCKETLNRDRLVATLNSFGQTIDPETSSAEQLLIAWINAAMLTLKSYIISNTKSQKLPCGRLNRWLNVPQVHEIRDLCDGVGICSLFALYCSNDVQVSEIAVPEPDDMLNIYETIANHSIIERLCHDLFPETVYHLRITDFLYIHGYMKQNILCFLVDLFNYLEINPVIRVNRLTHVPIRIEL